MDFASIERTTLLVDAGSGLFFLALGAWVLALRPRRPVTLALGAYAAALGLNVAVDNLGSGTLGWIGPQWEAVELVAVPAVASALVALALLFPRPLAGAGRRRTLAVAAGVAALQLVAVPLALVNAPSPFAAALDAAYILAYAANWFALATFALRYGRADAPEERRALAIVTVALGLEMGLRTGIAVLSPGAIAGGPVGIAALLSVASLVVLWLRNTARGPPAARASARNLALLFPALLVAGAGFAAATDPARAFNLGPMGLSRIAGVLLLAWAILRGLLPGVDARVRWGISRSTVAGAFVAVFFVAGEGAQLALGQGNEWVGLLAAGALVFVLAPLQRAAERLADRAVPMAPPAPEGALPPAGGGPLRVYRTAVRHAVRDRAVTREEERYLAELAESLGIGAATAFAVREEVEAERDRGAPARPGREAGAP